MFWTLRGHVTPADKATNDYLLLPFDVPPYVSRLTVSYAYTQAVSAAASPGSGNVIDIGCFDPRGAEFPHGTGFRGWSGSARKEFSLSLTDATPGYLSGPILPGCWHIVLGLYRLLSQGTDYQVDIVGERDDTAATEPRPIALSAPVLDQTTRWYRGDLHSHTCHSDAQGSLADLAAAARTRGLEFVAVTDHNTVSHWSHLAETGGDDLLLIPGEEITTYYGHANVWGASAWQGFRCRTPAQMAQVIAAAHEAGGLVSLNHPKDTGAPWQFGLELPFDCIEVWQEPWPCLNYQSLALWDSLLRTGRQIVAVGGSDRHQPPFNGTLSRYEVGNPTTWVYAREWSTAGILAGIRAGHVYITGDTTGPRVSFTCEPSAQSPAIMGDTVTVPAGTRLTFSCRIQGASGRRLRIITGGQARSVTIESADWSYEWSGIADEETYVRVEVANSTEEEVA
ncbi:MAG TPA: hypothetical protein EYP04_03570, partial [Anaerolineae bacterium]|nr:hypothetical protein [Anaerolineae bacterium]